MGIPARFPNGLATRAKTHPMGAFGAPDPAQWVTYFNDFLTFAAGDFTITEDNAGATEALAAGEGGWLALTATAADNDLVSLQLVAAPFVINPGKKAIFRARFKVSDATQSDVMFGMSLTDTSPIGDSAASSTNAGIFFFKADGAATARLEVGTGGTYTNSAALATLVDDTFIDLAWVYNGNDKISVYVDGVLTFEQTTLTNIPTTSDALNIIMAVNSGEVEATVLTIDHVFAAVER